MAAVASEGFVERIPFFTEYFFSGNQNFCFSIATGDGETRMHSEQCFEMWRRSFPFSNAFELKV